jgi:hypothetical protein
MEDFWEEIFKKSFRKESLVAINIFSKTYGRILGKFSKKC